MSFLVNPFRYAAAGCTDADAVAFLAAAGITDATITSAICTLVTTMKANGTWAKMQAIYPMVGGTATTHKFNLKNPADTDAAFRLGFVGGWTHTANGALPNGTNAYAITFFNPFVNASLNSHHMSYYSRTNIGAVQVEMGLSNNTSTASSLINVRNGASTRYRLNSGLVDIVGSDSDSRAYYIANRTASNVINGWRNSVKIANGTTVTTSLPNGVYWIGAFNNLFGPVYYYSTKQCAFSSIGSGLTDGEAAALYTSIQAFQTTLSRQV